MVAPQAIVVQNPAYGPAIFNLIFTISISSFCNFSLILVKRKQMKKILLPIALLALTITCLSFYSPTPKKHAHNGTSIQWTGKKFAGQHTGTIDFSRTDMKFENNKLVSANFDVDMESIKCTDLEGDMAGKLEGHLKAADFFGVQNHPIASFKSTKIESVGGSGYNITGNMTIKGITKAIKFQAKMATSGDHVTANARINVDRTKYGIKYKSKNMFEGLGDNFIYDDFSLSINIVDHL